MCKLFIGTQRFTGKRHNEKSYRSMLKVSKALLSFYIQECSFLLLLPHTFTIDKKKNSADNYMSSQQLSWQPQEDSAELCKTTIKTDGSINSESPWSLKQSSRTMLCLFAVRQLMKWPGESGHSPLADAQHSGKEIVAIVMLQKDNKRQYKDAVSMRRDRKCSQRCYFL